MTKEFQNNVDDLDLMRDEFTRIRCCPGATPEIKGLCERAVTKIRQRHPVIVQRDCLAAAVIQAMDLFKQYELDNWEVPVPESHKDFMEKMAKALSV